jgi:hypothetical protein
LKGLFAPRPAPTLAASAAADERVLDLERELQLARLELAEREQTVIALKEEVERQRKAEQTLVAAQVQSEIEPLLTECAVPLTQLLTQAHLLEVEGKPVQARDMWLVAKRLVRTFEDRGAAFQGHVGETCSFEAARHEPLSASISLNEGQPVRIRFVGMAYQGKLLRKAAVEAAEA